MLLEESVEKTRRLTNLSGVIGTGGLNEEIKRKTSSLLTDLRQDFEREITLAERYVYRKDLWEQYIMGSWRI
ncbi:MAG: hypothetical protein ACRD8Z_16190 [Nitrososphaeraceae archaeon]